MAGLGFSQPERPQSSGIPVWLTVTVGTLLVTALILTGIFHGKIDHKRSAPVTTVTASVPPVCEDIDQSTPCLLMPAPSGIERNAQPYPACDPDDRTPCAPVAARKHKLPAGYRHLTVAEARQWTDPLGKRLTPACIVKFGDTMIIRCPNGYVQES
jgi:hypothetical protein